MTTIAELDGRIGEGWGGLSPNGCHVNVVLAHRGSPTAAAAISMFAHPVAGSLAGALLRRRVAARVPADLAADADDEQGDGDDTRARDDDVGRRASSASARPSSTRLRPA